MFGSKLLRVIVTQILVLKGGADLSSFKPKGSDPLGFATAVAARLPCRVKKPNVAERSDDAITTSNITRTGWMQWYDRSKKFQHQRASARATFAVVAGIAPRHPGSDPVLPLLVPDRHYVFGARYLLSPQ